MAICASEVKLLQEAAAGICRIDPVAKMRLLDNAACFLNFFVFIFYFFVGTCKSYF